MRIISKDMGGYIVGKDVRPVAEVESGETFQVDTEDAFNALILKDSDVSEATIGRIVNRSCPITGPIFIKGAEPGDVLEISIDKIELGSYGVSVLGPEFCGIDDVFPSHIARVAPIVGDSIEIAERVTLPVKAMIGTIGVAPEEESVFSWKQGPYGGNMDCPDIGEGSKVYLPVSAPGALLYMGDVHAAQGDGEIANPFEAPARITLTPVVKKRGPSIGCPRVTTKDSLITIVSDRLFELAARQAFREMMKWLHDDYGVDKTTAALVLAHAADARCCQIGNSLYTARLVLDKKTLSRLASGCASCA